MKKFYIIPVILLVILCMIATTASPAIFQRGDVFTGVDRGLVFHYDSLGNFLDTLNTGYGGYTTGMAFDSLGNIYVTEFSNKSISIFSGPNDPHTVLDRIYTGDLGDNSTESIVFDTLGNFYVGHASGNADIHKYDASGNRLAVYNVETERIGSDWIDLAADQRTIYYTSEGRRIMRYDVVADSQLPDFALLPGAAANIMAYALRILPDRGIIVADLLDVKRLDASGNIIQTYDVPGENTWFSLNVNWDMNSFWSGNFGTGKLYKFDIDSGDLLDSINTGVGSGRLWGIAVFGEFIVTAGIADQCVYTGDLFPTINLDNFAVGVPPFTWSWTGNTDLSVNIDSSNKITITYPEGWYGSETITFTVTDSLGGTADDPATFTVCPVPVVLDIPDQKAPFIPFDLDDYLDPGSGVDPEAVTWSADGMVNLVIDINPITHVVTVTDTAELTEDETIVFTATVSPCCLGLNPISDSDYVTFSFGGGITPTNEWINVYCGNPMLNGVVLNPGDTIKAYDPDGVLCGMDTVRADGSFGFMPIYADEPYNPGDQGAEPGDTITFWINDTEVQTDPVIVWTTNGDMFELCDFYTCKVCHLEPGWNLVSWNRSYAANIEDFMAMLGDDSECVDVILGFDQGALTYDPDLVEYSTLENVDYHFGYWFKMTCPVDLEICTGKIQSEDFINIHAGWNLVSYWPDETLPVDSALFTINNSVLAVLGFDNGGLTYVPGDAIHNTLTDMQSCMGYWIKSSDDAMLLYPGWIGPPLVAARTSPSTMTSDVITPSHNWVSLYGSSITVDGIDLEDNALIEAYTSDGVLCGQGRYTDGLLKFTPVYGYDESDQFSKTYPKQGDEITLHINGQVVSPTVSWTANGDRIRIARLQSNGASDLIPGQFVLNQNYPNPFNPATEISFDLPQPAHVRLEVYNIVGQLVSVLLDDNRQAGTHTVTWDGVDRTGQPVASGLYFYRITAGDNIDTKKMLLLK